MTVLSEKLKLFTDQHGPLVRVGPAEWVCPDGASFTGGEMSPPAADPVPNQRRFHAVRLALAEADLAALEAGRPVLWDDSRYGPPQPTAGHAIGLLRALIRREQRALAELDAEPAAA